MGEPPPAPNHQWVFEQAQFLEPLVEEDTDDASIDAALDSAFGHLTIRTAE